MKKNILLTLMIVFLLWGVPQAWSMDGLCGSLLQKTLNEQGIDLEVHENYLNSLTRFIFSKPSKNLIGDMLSLKVMGRREKSAMACKFKSNRSLEKLFPHQKFPMDDCLQLNKYYLDEHGIDLNQVELVGRFKKSGPGWIMAPIVYSNVNQILKIEIPYLITETSFDGKDGTFQGMHYCKIVDLDLVADKLYL